MPEIRGDERVKALGYRTDRSQLIVGAPFAAEGDTNRVFHIDMDCPGHLQHSAWLLGSDAGDVTIDGGRCLLHGRGAFVLAFEPR